MSSINPVQFYKSLADEIRLTSLMLIAQEGELCVCELMAALDESQPKISRHLAQLRSIGLLQDRRQGQWVYYSLHPDLDKWMSQVLHTTLEENKQFLADSAQRLISMSSRPGKCA